MEPDVLSFSSALHETMASATMIKPTIFNFMRPSFIL
jgi:hypothetical protein